MDSRFSAFIIFEMAKTTKSKKRAVPLDALEAQLQDQLAFLERSIAAFDEGYDDEFKRLAVTLRVLLHDTSQSHSLLKQLNMKDGDFFAYSSPISETNLLPDWPLARVRMGSDGVKLLPALDQTVRSRRSLSFDDWWSEKVYRDPAAEIVLDRKTIVLAVTNKDGGAHVDPEIDEYYAHLVNSGVGLVAITAEGEILLEDLEKVSLRHIAFEALMSIKPGAAKRLGNRGCECGSGLKHRYCCGKKRMPLPTFP